MGGPGLAIPPADEPCVLRIGVPSRRPAHVRAPLAPRRLPASWTNWFLERDGLHRLEARGSLEAHPVVEVREGFDRVALLEVDAACRLPQQARSKDDNRHLVSGARVEGGHADVHDHARYRENSKHFACYPEAASTDVGLIDLHRPALGHRLLRDLARCRQLQLVIRDDARIPRRYAERDGVGLHFVEVDCSAEVPQFVERLGLVEHCSVSADLPRVHSVGDLNVPLPRRNRGAMGFDRRLVVERVCGPSAFDGLHELLPLGPSHKRSVSG